MEQDIDKVNPSTFNTKPNHNFLDEKFSPKRWNFQNAAEQTSVIWISLEFSLESSTECPTINK